MLLTEYQKELVGIGRQDLEPSLYRALEVDDDPILQIALAMDAIKEQVPEDARQRLYAVDCEIQQTVKEGGEINVHQLE